MYKNKIEYALAKDTFRYFIIFLIIGVFLTAIIGNIKTKGNRSGVSPWMGVETVELTNTIITKYKIHSPRGLLVARTFMGSPAELAGIKSGDVIRRWNGISITSLKQFQKLIKRSRMDETIRITVDRDRTPMVMRVVLGLRPGTF